MGGEGGQQVSRAAGSLVAGAAVMVLVVACAPGGADKSGSDVLRLDFATVDGQVSSSGYQPGPEVFISSLQDLSGDRIQVDVATEYGGMRAVAESELVQAVADGEIDGGWPAGRAFAAAGIPGLAALEAPMTITGYAAESELVQGEAARLVAASLDGHGVKDLGLLVGPPRRPFGVDVFPLAVRDWQGLRFRSFNSPVETATIEALGAQPVQAGADWLTMAQADQLDGVELDVAQYFANGFGRQAGKVVSNVVLWPKMPVLVLNQELWDGLTDQQRGWIQEAADRAVQASVDAAYPEDEVASQLCARGTRFRAADPGELLAMRAAVQPVIDGLAADPAEAALLHEVQSVAGLHPADVITVEDSCTTEATLPDESDVPTTLAPIPEGTYRKQITEEDVAQAGLGNNDGTSGTWTLEVRDGHWYVRCRPLDAPGLDCGHTVDDGVLDAGTFYGDDRLAWMVAEPAVLSAATGCRLPAAETEGHCHPPAPPARLDWTLDGRDLVFSSLSVSLGFETILKPYVRID
jgi:TRAP-type C4-dicarboxylate transport system substrate-binding protein